MPTWKVTSGRTPGLYDPGLPDISWSGAGNINETHFLPKIGISKDLNEYHTVGFFYFGRLPHRWQRLRLLHKQTLHV